MPTATKHRTPTRRDRRTRAARAERRDSRADLLAAALEVFAERGYQDASIDEIAQRAGYSKGVVYWHFKSKEELFFVLTEEAIDRPWRQTIALLESSPPEHDMAVAASRRFTEMLRNQGRLLVVQHEYWLQALRDPRLRRRYRDRQRALRTALARAIEVRLERLGAPPLGDRAEAMAATFVAIALGLTQEKLLDPTGVSDDLLGESFALLYAGHVARTREARP